MNFREWIGKQDAGALVIGFFVGSLSLIALMLLINRFERIALAKRVDREWIAPTGTELRLAGLEEGPLVAVETSPGGGLTINSPKASLVKGGPVDRVIWISRGKGDNKTQVQVSLIGQGGAVALSRSGQAETPALFVRVEKASLLVESGVTVGDLLEVPEIKVAFGDREDEPAGRGFSFMVPPGSTLSIELPTFPDGTPSGVVPSLGAVSEKQNFTSLAVREVGTARGEVEAPYEALCATKRQYAWSLFFRPDLFPFPRGQDCTAGAMTARNFTISRDSVAVSLLGQAWHMEDGKPTESLWSWAKSNDVLSLVINELLPAAVGIILGFFAWRRRTGAATPPIDEKAAAQEAPASAESPKGEVADALADDRPGSKADLS